MRRADAKGFGQDDEAVSPVIAVILMVAITVVLAATVYVWVSGFTDTGDQAPSANARFIACDVSKDQVTMRLNSGGPVAMDEVKLILYNATDNTQEAVTDPLHPGGQGYGDNNWETGEQISVTQSGGSHPNWDSALNSNGGLDDGTQYRIDFIHKPTQSTFLTLPFTC